MFHLSVDFSKYKNNHKKKKKHTQKIERDNGKEMTIPSGQKSHLHKHTKASENAYRLRTVQNCNEIVLHKWLVHRPPPALGRSDLLMNDEKFVVTLSVDGGHEVRIDERSGWGSTVKLGGRAVDTDRLAHKITTDSLTGELEAVTHAVQ